MTGLKQKLTLSFLGLGALLSTAAQAHVPYPAQIFRFQPALIKNESAYESSGRVAAAGSSIVTQIKWYAPGNYEVVLDNVPARFHRLENQSSTWVLRRQGNNCTLRAYGQAVGCGAPKFWALLEFSSDIQSIANSLVREGFYSKEDTMWVESDGRQAPTSANRTRLALGSNGNRPVAALEVTGAALGGGSFFGAGNESNNALVQFDQTFLKPIHARFRSEGETFVINGQADLEVRKGKPRFSYILANKVDVIRGASEVATFSRGEPKPLKGGKGPEAAGTITGVEALQENLSASGRSLLQALLLTH